VVTIRELQDLTLIAIKRVAIEVIDKNYTPRKAILAFIRLKVEGITNESAINHGKCT